MGENLKEYQRNVTFVAFILVVCFAACVYTAKVLCDVLVPLVWSGFFAVPLIALISKINSAAIEVCSWLSRSFRGVHGDASHQEHSIPFRMWPGENRIIMQRTPAVLAMLESLSGPCSDSWGSRARQGCCSTCGFRRQMLQCCQCRVRITQLVSNNAVDESSEVNRLVQNWAYYVADPCWLSTAVGVEAGSVEEVHLALFLDQAGKYPAVIAGSQLTGSKEELTGTLELDKTSTLSWSFSVLLALVIMFAGVYTFVMCITLGVRAFSDNAHAYQVGIEEFLAWSNSTFRNILPESLWDSLEEEASGALPSAMSSICSSLLSNFEYIGWEALLFIIYLFFWIFEPLPVSSSVAQVFKTYLLLKTVVCLLFAALMSALLRFLQCPLWHLFFVVTFLLNYIPEVGAIASAILMIPAVLFDGNLSLEQRKTNFLWLAFCGVLFKVITGNIVEVQMYATMGGQHMRMHPVVMMALMMLCEALLGITGMFLAIPIMAAVKFYMVSADMPEVFLNPLLKMLEGDQAGPHKNFVERHNASYGTVDDEGPSATPGRDARRA